MRLWCNWAIRGLLVWTVVLSSWNSKGKRDLYRRANDTHRTKSWRRILVERTSACSRIAHRPRCNHFDARSQIFFYRRKQPALSACPLEKLLQLSTAQEWWSSTTNPWIRSW